MDFLRHHKWIVVVPVLLLLLGVAAWLSNPSLTRFLEGPAFRAELDKQTAKGLHFESGRYDKLHRKGFLGAATDDFHGKDGVKAMRSLTARDITAKFNPWGFFLRRWQLEDVHIASGDVAIQVYEPKPEQKKPKPWYAIFLPDRVYLKDIICDAANVTWRIRKEEGGFYDTRLHITPHGRDFNYEATSGIMKMPLMPDLHLRRVFMLITKEKLELHELLLHDKGKGRIFVQGNAGMKEDKQIEVEAHVSDMEIAPWMPDDWKKSFTGLATAKIVWKGKDRALENSSGHGWLSIAGARIANAPFLEQAAALTKKEAFRNLRFDEFSLKFEWDYPRIEISAIDIEVKKIFRIRGGFVIHKRSLEGKIQLGVTREYLEWLQKPEEIFTEVREGYRVTSVRFFGTVDDPKEDLSPRIIKLFAQSPSLYLGAVFRLFGGWLGGFFEP